MTGARSLAAAQTIPTRGDVEANLAGHIRLIHAAAKVQARVLVFPELSLTGYELDLANDLAFSENDPRLTPLIELASSYHMTLIVGAPVRIEPRLYIGAFILSPDRSVDLYTKHRLGAFPLDASPDGIVPPAEATVFHPGQRNPLVQFDGNTAAVAVCADIGRPSHAREAADRGARNYLASMFVIPADLEPETARLREYAVKHSMAVVFANFGGPTGGLPSGGSSAIVSEQGELLAQLPASGEGIAIASEDETGWRGKVVTGYIRDGLLAAKIAYASIFEKSVEEASQNLIHHITKGTCGFDEGIAAYLALVRDYLESPDELTHLNRFGASFTDDQWRLILEQVRDNLVETAE